MGIKRFLNADEIAKGLSPLDPSLVAFRAGRLLLQEVESLLKTQSSFAIESTLSGKTYVELIRRAKALGYRFILHYLVLPSSRQAIDRVGLRVLLGGHHVPEEDVERRFSRSRKHFVNDYLPLADEWHVWDNEAPPSAEIANSHQDTAEEVIRWFSEDHLMETPSRPVLPSTRLGLEASQRATAKMLAHYQRMGIQVTPQMTLADPAEPKTPKGEPVGK